MNKQWLIRLGFILIFLAGVLASAGCAIGKVPSPASSPWWNPFKGAANATQEINSLLTLVAGFAILAIALGVTLGIYLKTSLGPAVAIGGGVALVLSLFLKTTLWFIPWVLGLVVLAGTIAFIIDVRKRGFWNAVKDVRDILDGPNK